MPVLKQQRLPVSCPACGHRQLEPAAAISTNCRRCGQHILVQEVLHPPAESARPNPKQRRITCFECGVEQEVVANAQSTMCRKCSRYIDLADYRITNAVSKNFKTKGSFIVEPKGNVFNTEAIVGEAVLKGRFAGKLSVEGGLTIYSSAQIKGSFTAGKLIIPQNNVFTWKPALAVRSAEIAGEFAGHLVAGKVLLTSTGRFFGDLWAASLRIEEGAVFVGTARVPNPE